MVRFLIVPINKMMKNFPYIKFIFTLLLFFCFLQFMINYSNINARKEINKLKQSKNGLINENFFIIDSNNLEIIKSHMFGFSISKEGILTNNYYKLKGNYEVPEPQGVYIMIRKKENKIIINQDFHGNFGLYIYQNKDKHSFVLSNSFLLLVQYLIGKQNISINIDFVNNFIVSGLCTPSIFETMIKEIIKVPSNKILIIDIQKKRFWTEQINYEESTIPFESKESLEIIDEWVDKWGYIIRSLIKKTKNISSDLTGGFDTRVILSIFLKSGIDLNKILINTATDKKFCHKEDLEIARHIANKFGFKLNNFILDNNGIEWGLKDIFSCTFYSKLGFHNQFYYQNKFFEKPRFKFHGGGEIRGPGMPIKKYIERLSSKGKALGNKFYFSSKKLCERSVTMIKKEKKYSNDYEISYLFYQKGRSANHDGKMVLEGFLSNTYVIQPLIDSVFRKIKFNDNKNSMNDLIAYIYIRFAHDLINFPFQGKRILKNESIIKAEKLNLMRKPYIIKYDYNDKFLIDFKRKSPIPKSKEIKILMMLIYI